MFCKRAQVFLDDGFHPISYVWRLTNGVIYGIGHFSGTETCTKAGLWL